MNSDISILKLPDTQANFDRCLAEMQTVFAGKSAEYKEVDKLNFCHLFKKMLDSEHCKEKAALQKMLACKGYPAGNASTLEKAANLVKFWSITAEEKTDICKLFKELTPKEESSKIQADKTPKKPEEEVKQLFVTVDKADKVAAALLRQEADKKFEGQRIGISVLTNVSEVDPSRFYIKTRKEAGDKRRWVQVKEGDQQIFLNIKSLSKRLFVSLDDIQTAEKEGRLEKLIADQSIKLRQALEVYQKNKNDKLTPEFLLKLCLVGHELWLNPDKIKPLHISGGPIAKGALITEGQELEADQGLLVRINQGRIHVIDLTNKNLMREGGWGDIYEADDLVTNTPFIVKKSNYRKEAGVMLIDEGDKLQKLAEKGVTKAQGIPIMVVDARTGQKGDLNRQGNTYMVVEKADIDMWDWVETKKYNREHRVALAKQVWEQFEEILDLGLYHADIKPENFLLFKKNNEFLVKLIDWAFATLDINQVPIDIGLPSRQVTPQPMVNALISSLKAVRIRGAICHDRFAIATCLFFLFADHAPYDVQATGRPTGKYWEDGLNAHKCSDELKSLLKDLLKLGVPQTDAEIMAQNMDFRARWAEIVKSNNFFLK